MQAYFVLYKQAYSDKVDFVDSSWGKTQQPFYNGFEVANNDVRVGCGLLYEPLSLVICIIKVIEAHRYPKRGPITIITFNALHTRIK
jgi:hypothetical protein